MSRTFPVPLQFSSVLASPPGNSTDVRTLTTSTPSGGESTATTLPAGFSEETYELVPESVATTSFAQITHWQWDSSEIAQENADVVFGAGDWRVITRASRPGGLLTGNVTISLQMILLVVRWPYQIVFQHNSSFSINHTVTTTEQSFAVVTSVPQFTLPAGAYLALVLRATRREALVSDTVRFHTNSGSACNVAQIPNYTLRFNKGLGDAAGSSADAILRFTTTSRALADAGAGAADDTLTRAATFPRMLADAGAGSDQDEVQRQFSGARALADAAGTQGDAIDRSFTGSRALADNEAGSPDDTVDRQFNGARTLVDTAAGFANDTLERTAIFNRELADEAGADTDAIDRAFTGSRALQDADAGTDDEELARLVTYSRELEDNLYGEGGEPQPLPPGILRLRPDGRYEALMNGQTLPPGAVRLTTV